MKQEGLMSKCQYCGEEIDEDYFYCPHCTVQLRCITCGKSISKTYLVCPFCGTETVPKTTTEAINEYTFLEEKEGDKYKRSVSLKASNLAVEKLAKIIITSPQPLLGPTTKLPEDSLIKSFDANQQPLLTPANDSNIKSEFITPTTTSEPYELIKDYIFPLDGNLEVKLGNFQGNSIGENQQRFILLFVGSFHFYFHDQVPTRTLLLKKAKDLGLWDTNFSKNIAKLGKVYLIETSDGLRLSPTGKQEIVKIVNEILDPNTISTSNNLVKPGRKPNRNKPKTGEKDNQEINEWKIKLGDLANYEVRELGKLSVRQKLQFGLWVLEKKVGINRVQLAKLIKFINIVFPTLGSTAESLRKSVKMGKYFQKTDAGEIFLTKDGQSDIEALLSEDLKA